MKKILLMAATLLITGVTFAHGNGWKNDDNATEKEGKFWQQMNTFRQIMHSTDVNAKNIDDGVALTINKLSEAAQKTLKEDLNLSQESLSTYFDSVEVALDIQGETWVISFSASDDKLIKRLQNNGSGLWYEFLQQKMVGVMHTNNGNGYMGGNHMMNGMGPGMMYGNNQGCQGGSPGVNQSSYQGYMGDGAMMNNGMM